jgi:N-methylhydantoinase A/oxoprolinase/acetone carboxylase beta subunit
MTIEGPAIIEQMDTTTVILPDQTARVTRDGMLRLTFRTP